MKKRITFNRQYLAAVAVIICSLALGAATMSAIMHSSVTAEAAPAPLKKTFNVDYFTDIEVSSGIEVILRQGEFDGTVTATSSNAKLNNLDIRVENRKLIVGLKPNTNARNSSLKVYVTMDKPARISVSSGAEVKVEGALRLDGPLSVIASSGAELSFGEITGTVVKFSASSGAEIFALLVDTEAINVEASSGAEVKLRGINAAKVDANGASGAEITLAGRCNFKHVVAKSAAEITTRGLVIENMPIQRYPDAAEMQQLNYRQP